MTATLEARLAGKGLSGTESIRKAELFERAGRALESLGEARVQPRRWFVPGRIEFLGKHTDYAGGPSLLCAVERGFCVVASHRSDRLVRIVDAGRQEMPLQLTLIADRSQAREAGDWTTYAETVVRRVARNFSGTLYGADIAFASDLPQAAGLSSSSALITTIFTVLCDANHLNERREYRSNICCQEDLAGYLGGVENGSGFGTLDGDAGVGTFGGSEDHTAILCCHPGQLSLYTFHPVRCEGIVPLPPDHTFVIGVSGVAAEKNRNAREAYNRAALAAKSILKLWCAATGRSDPTLRAVATQAPDGPNRMREILRHSADPQFSPKALLDRFDQFLEETQRIIPMATEALKQGELSALGELVDCSQEAAQHLLGNQIAETIELARLARTHGAAAASAFGAGFGGSVWALVSAKEAAGFRVAWEASYHRQFSGSAETSQFFISGAGPALFGI